MNRILIAAFALALSAGAVHAQSATAYDNATCNASFLNKCSGGGSVSEAPLPIAGIPTALALLAGATLARCRRRQRRA